MQFIYCEGAIKITEYIFGRIVVGGRVYTSDIIIYPEKVYSPWWRIEGHKLLKEDLKEVIKARPDILIIGTGYSGSMHVPEETVEYLKSKDIEVNIMRTGEAAKVFNEMSKDRVVIAALHLTC